MHCWINRNNGHALIDDSGAVVGVIVDVHNQIQPNNMKRLYGPSEWFVYHVYKKREVDSRKGGVKAC